MTGEKYREGSPRPESCELYETDLNGNIIKQITHSKDIREGHARWSPDGTKIVFGAGGLYPGIYVMNSDSTDPHILISSQTKRKVSSFCWSPDGSKIAFTWYEEYGRYEGHREWANIFIINVDGSEITPITFNDSTDIKSIVWDWR